MIFRGIIALLLVAIFGITEPAYAQQACTETIFMFPTVSHRVTSKVHTVVMQVPTTLVYSGTTVDSSVFYEVRSSTMTFTQYSGDCRQRLVAGERVPVDAAECVKSVFLMPTNTKTSMTVTSTRTYSQSVPTMVVTTTRSTEYISYEIKTTTASTRRRC